MIGGVYLVALIFGRVAASAGPMTISQCRATGADALAAVGEVFGDPISAANVSRLQGERVHKEDVFFVCAEQRPATDKVFSK